MFCEDCGKEIVNNAKFCKHCGKMLDATIQQVDSMQKEEVSTQGKARKSRYSKMVIGVLVSALAMALLLGGSLLLKFALGNVSDDVLDREEQNTIGLLEGEENDSKKKVLVRVEELSKEDGEFHAYIKYEYSHDDNGNMTSKSEYYLEDDIFLLQQKYEYEYDEDGNCIKEKEYDSNGELRFESEYDKAGKVIKKSDYTEGNVVGWYEYEYDEKGNQLKETYITVGGVITGWYEWEYDKKGNKTKYVCHFVDKGDMWSYDWEYDEKGNVTRERHISGGEVRTDDVWEYEYDERENMTKKTYYILNGRISDIYEYTYDEQGHLVKELCISSSTGKPSRECEYDSNGNKTKEVSYDVQNSTILWHCEYKYDMDGDEMEAIEYDSDGNIIGNVRWVYEYIEVQ